MCVQVLTVLQFIYYKVMFDYNWQDMAPLDLFIGAFWRLHFTWIKLYLIWRFSRLPYLRALRFLLSCCSGFTLLDNVETTENMSRYVQNNATFRGFWRNWHASFNRWAIRYMYIPMGGRQRNFLNVWPIFLFIGFWHGIEWEWVVCRQIKLLLESESISSGLF